MRIVRLSDGTKLQACQTDSHLCVYRFDGEIAVPAAAFARKATSSDEWPPNNPYTSQAWMWVDQNDDGDFQASEFDTIADANISVMRAWFFDDEGAVWIGEQETGTIHRYPLGTGSEPMYSRSSRILTQAPSDITRVRSLYYDPCGDTMYMGTYSNDNPYEFWGPMSREIRRFDQWSTAKTARWTIAIPYMYTGNRSQDIYPRALDVEGDYVFVAYDLGSDDERHRGEVVVFRASDGTEVGSLWLGEEVGSSGGALDHGACVHVHQLANGTYVVLIEEDEFAKIVYYQWHDDGQVNLCDPPGV